MLRRIVLCIARYCVSSARVRMLVGYLWDILGISFELYLSPEQADVARMTRACRVASSPSPPHFPQSLYHTYLYALYAVLSTVFSGTEA